MPRWREAHVSTRSKIGHSLLVLAIGLVVDVGAGNGYTAERLTSGERRVIACEPSAILTNSVVRPRPAVPQKLEFIKFLEYVTTVCTVSKLSNPPAK